MHARNSVVSSSHSSGKLVNSLPGVAVDDSLSDGKSLIKIVESLIFPLLLVNGNVELTDTFESKLSSLHEDSCGITHELGGQTEDLFG